MEKEENYNFDIGLVKLDRAVMFSPDMAPICLDGFLPEYKPTDDAVFISGFGLTLYKRSKKIQLVQSANLLEPSKCVLCSY